MFEVNDYIVYGLTGVCQITAIGKDKYSSDDETQYYILKPVNTDNMTIKVPVNNKKLSIRAVLSKDEALALIASMPDQDIICPDDERQRTLAFKAALKSGKSEEWVKIIKTLHLENKAKSVDGKTISKTDKETMRIAEKYLHEELAIALNISADEVASYIREHITKKKKLKVKK